MKVCVLASGSKGNATLIQSGETLLLIDAGISFRRLKGLMEANGFDPARLDAVFLSHEHSDHTKGLETLSKRVLLKLYTPLKTYQHITEKTTMDITRFMHYPVEPDVPISLNDLTVMPIALSHDSNDSVGFVIQGESKTIVHVTDVGFLPETDYPKLHNADLYVFESNYDVSLLFSSDRPYYLKRRIDSVRGHLSNTDSAYHMTHLIGDKTKTIILAHPSLECNSEHHVLKTYREIFDGYGLSLDRYHVIVAKQHEPTEVVEL